IELGGGYCNFGNWVRSGGQPETALGWYEKAIARLEPVGGKEARLVDALWALRASHAGRAGGLDDLGRHAGGVRDWERGLGPGRWPQKGPLPPADLSEQEGRRRLPRGRR